jgi:predicted DNA-binding protein (MmcQ/YjbR family)
MDLDSIRAFCLSLPHVTEDIQWGNDLLFRIGGKIFAGVSLEPPHNLAFKCTPEKFDELVEIDGIIPAPYMARNKWVSILDFNALSDEETKRLMRNSYEMILSGLPKKLQTEFAGARTSPPAAAAARPASKKKSSGPAAKSSRPAPAKKSARKSSKAASPKKTTQPKKTAKKK